MYKEEVKEALLAWVRVTADIEVESWSELWNGRVLFELLQKISNFQSSDLELINDEEPKMVLANLKRINKALASYYDLHLRTRYDPDFVDLLSISQGRSSHEIFKFFVQVFGACVQAPNKQTFIISITKLHNSEQEQLMTLIKSHHFYNSGSEPKEKRKSSCEQEPESGHQSEIRALLDQVEKQETVIERLEKELMQQKAVQKELEKKLMASEEENQRLRDEIDSGITNQQFLMPENIEIEKAAMQNENSAMIEELKQQLIKEAEKHLQEKAELNEEIEFLREKLEKNKAEATAAQEEASREQSSPTKNIFMDHPPCISMTKHNELLSARADKIKELQKSEWEANHRILTLKAENDELQRQRNKLQQEASQKTQLITRTDYDALKINILSLLNDRFKVEVAKLKEARPS